MISHGKSDWIHPQRLGGHRGEFRSRSADDETVDAAVDRAVDDLAEQCPVDVLLGVEGGGQGGEDTAEVLADAAVPSQSSP